MLGCESQVSALHYWLMTLRSAPITSLTLGLLTFLSFAIASYVYVVDLSARPLIDFEVYMSAGRSLLAGENIYAHPYAVTDRAGRLIPLYYLYPPLLAHLLSKCALVDLGTLKRLWCVLNFCSTCISILCIAKILERSWWSSYSYLKRVAIVGFFTFCFEPIYVGVGDGQVTAIVLALLSLFMLACISGRDLVAGSLLAVAIQVKMSPALLLLGPVLFGKWRTISSCLMTVAALSLFTAWDLGSTQVFADFRGSLFNTIDDQLLGGFAFNIVMHRALLGPFGLAQSVLARWLFKAALLLLTVMGAVGIHRQSGGSYLRSLAFLATCMVFISPIIWFHHLAWVLLPIAVLSMKPAETADARMKSLTICLGLYFALSQTYLLMHWTMRLAPELMPISLAMPPLLLLLTAGLVFRQKAP